MLLFSDRRRREGRFLEWKVWIFSAAAVLVLTGMYLDERWMTGTAIVLLAGAMALGFLPGGANADPAGDAEDEPEPPETDRPEEVDRPEEADRPEM